MRISLFLDSTRIGKLSGGFTLIVIRKSEPREIFVGELNANIEFVKKVVKSFKNKETGRISQLGFFIEPKFYINFHRLIINKTIQDLVQKKDFKKIHFR